jgi:vacuolar protein 8
MTDRRARVDVEDLLVRVKNGTEPELGAVAREVAALAGEGRLGEDDDEDGLLVPALLARLAGAGDAETRVLVMAALRRLAGCAGGQSKVRASNRLYAVLLVVSFYPLWVGAHALCSCGVVLTLE